MALNERERWVHYFSVLMTVGALERVPQQEIMMLAGDICKERCRSLSMEEIEGIIEELDEEQRAGKIAMDEILHRITRKIKKWNPTSTHENGENDFFDFKGGSMK